MDTIAFEIVDASDYYNNRSNSFDAFFYRSDKPMSINARYDVAQILRRRQLYDVHGDPYDYTEAEPGMVYRAPGNSEIMGYLVDNEPFEAIMQIVGIHEQYVTLQEIDADEERHRGHVPHHQTHLRDFYNMARRLQFDGGRFQGIFEYTRRGSRLSLRVV